MGVLILGEVAVKEDALETIKAFLRELLPDTRAFEGCEGVAVYTDRETPTRLLFVEQWRSMADQEKYIAWRTETGDMDKLGAMVAGPYNVRVFENIEG